MASTRTRMEWQNTEKTKQEKSMRRSCECATSSLGSQVQGIKSTVEEDICSSDDDGCTSPKAKRFRIQEVLTCPPAPKKKRRVMPSCSSNTSLLAFFASSDIELFFSSALRNVSEV